MCLQVAQDPGFFGCLHAPPYGLVLIFFFCRVQSGMLTVGEEEEKVGSQWHREDAQAGEGPQAGSGLQAPCLAGC